MKKAIHRHRLDDVCRMIETCCPRSIVNLSAKTLLLRARDESPERLLSLMNGVPFTQTTFPICTV